MARGGWRARAGSCDVGRKAVCWTGAGWMANKPATRASSMVDLSNKREQSIYDCISLRISSKFSPKTSRVNIVSKLSELPPRSVPTPFELHYRIPIRSRHVCSELVKLSLQKLSETVVLAVTLFDI